MIFLKHSKSGRKFLSLLLATTLALPMVSFADYKTIYETVESEALSSGVTHEQYVKLTNGGWINLNVLRVDLKNQNIKVKPIYPMSSLSKKEKLTTMADPYTNLIGAVNADFFDPKSSSTLGQIIDEGNLITTGTNNTKMATFSISKEALAYVDYIKDYGLQLINPKYTLSLAFKNKPYLDYNRAIIFDRKWSAKSYGNTLNKGIIEMLIVDNMVANIVENGPPLDIPVNGYVVSAVGTKIAEIRNNFAIGDPCSINYSESLKNMDFSIGGGSLMVKDGKPMTTFTTNIAGNHPRTAVGITQDRTQMIIVTIDGRTKNFRGVNQPELASILVSLGAYEGINLDGGGSTEMILKPLGNTKNKIQNFPSDGGERRVHNGIGIFSTSTSSTIDSLIIDKESAHMLKGSFINVNLYGVDSNRNPIGIDPTQVMWTVESGVGSVSGGVLTAEKEGTLTLRADYGGKIAKTTITVHKDLVDLEFNPRVISLKHGETLTLALNGLSTTGQKLPISPTSVIWNIPNNLMTLQPNGTVTAGNTDGKGILIANVNGITKHIPVVIGADIKLLDDFTTNKAAFSAYPQLVTGSWTVGSFGKNGDSAGQLLYEFSGTEQTRAAYINYGTSGILIPEGTDKIGVDVFGTYGNNHWLRAKVIDSTGKSAVIDFERFIDWTDWKYVEAPLPRELKGPFKLERLYLAEDDPVKRDSGSILVDNLIAVTPHKNDILLPLDIDKLPRIGNMKIKTTGGTRIAVYGEFNGKETLIHPENLTAIAKVLNKFRYSYFAGALDPDTAKLLGAEIVANKYSEIVVGETIVVTMNSKNDSFIKADPLQLEKFLARMKNFRYKNLVLVTNHSMNFTDPFEEKLMTSQIESLNAKGVKTYILSGSQNNNFDVRLKNSSTIIDLQSLNKYSGFDPRKDAFILTMNLFGSSVEFELMPIQFVVKDSSKVIKPGSVKTGTTPTAKPK